MRRTVEKVDEYGNPVERSRLGTAFTVCMGLVSAAIFLVVFVRIFQTRDSEITDRLILDESAYRHYAASQMQMNLPENADGERLRGYSVYPSTTRDTEGRIQVRDVYYLESADRLMLTVRLNTRYFPEENGLGYDFVLRIIDSRDGSYGYNSDSYRITDVRNGYTFLRIAFRVPEMNEFSTVRLHMLPKGGDPADSSYLNLKIYGNDVYAQDSLPKPENVVLWKEEL